MEIMSDGRYLIHRADPIISKMCVLNIATLKSKAGFLHFATEFGRLIGAEELIILDICNGEYFTSDIDKINELIKGSMRYYISGVIMSPESWSIACIKYSKK